MLRIRMSRANRQVRRRAAILSVALVVLMACSNGHDASTVTVPPTVLPTVANTANTSGGTTTAATTTTGGPTTSTGSTASGTTIAGSGSTSVDAQTATTASRPDATKYFDFRAPPTDPKDVPLLDVYRTFMTMQERIGRNLSDPGLRAQLAAITTAAEDAVLQKAFDDLAARGATYRVVEPVTYHPFVLYGDAYRDGFRTVADCFIEAAAFVDPDGNPMPGETLDRASKGFVAEFELHDGAWLASGSYDDPSSCLLSA